MSGYSLDSGSFLLLSPSRWQMNKLTPLRSCAATSDSVHPHSDRESCSPLSLPLLLLLTLSRFAPLTYLLYIPTNIVRQPQGQSPENLPLLFPVCLRTSIPCLLIFLIPPVTDSRFVYPFHFEERLYSLRSTRYILYSHTTRLSLLSFLLAVPALTLPMFL